MKKVFFLLILCVVLLFVFSCNNEAKPSVEVKSETRSQTTVDISIDESMVRGGGIDNILIESRLLDQNGLVVRSAKKSYSSSDIEGQESLRYNLENFGKSEVVISYKKGGDVVKKTNLEYILTAEKYNVAFLIATVPVTYFTLLMVDQDGDKAVLDPTLPTIFSIQRAQSYDFDNLLDNMYPLPFVSMEKLTTCSASIPATNYTDELFKATYEYIGYLHKLNPESTFNLIAYDRCPEDAMLMLYCNGLDPKKNRITLISDGVATYNDFKAVFGDEQSYGGDLAKYNQYEEKWKTIKEKSLSGDLTFASMEKSGTPFHAGECQLCAYNTIMANDSDIDFKWVMSRKRNDTFGNSDVYDQKLKDNINAVAINMGDYVKSSGGKLDDNEKASLKAIYKFNEDVFSEAKEQNKKIMIFLGAASQFEKCDYADNNATLEIYLSFVSNYLDKDRYALFYKGHPGHIYSYPERNTIVENAGFTILDPAIPAELFYLFDPNVEMCGYHSSTFDVYPQSYKSPFVNIDETYTDVYFTPKKDDGTFDVIRKSDNKKMNWDPNNPSVMNWVDNI